MRDQCYSSAKCTTCPYTSCASSNGAALSTWTMSSGSSMSWRLRLCADTAAMHHKKVLQGQLSLLSSKTRSQATTCNLNRDASQEKEGAEAYLITESRRLLAIRSGSVPVPTSKITARLGISTLDQLRFMRLLFVFVASFKRDRLLCFHRTTPCLTFSHLPHQSPPSVLTQMIPFS